jgi:site-specific recombinase
MATPTGRWDLTALLNAADAKASQPERHTWLIRLVEWLRHRSDEGADAEGAEPGAPSPVRRLRHLLNVLDKNEAYRAHVRAMLRALLRDTDASTLLADFGFAPRMAFMSELVERLRLATLPGTPQTADLGALFHLVFTDAQDARWLDAIDDDTLSRVVALLSDGEVTAPQVDWRDPFLDAVTVLVSQTSAAGFSAAVRQRMDAAALSERPFQQLARAADQVRDAAQAHAAGADDAALLQSVQYLRALLDACRVAARSVRSHLEEYGVSVDIVFQVDQLRARTERIDALLNCIVAPEPAREILKLVAHLVRIGHERRSVRALFAHNYSLMARKLTERSAETGERYITRNRAEYWSMLKKALGGGAVLAATTLIKFGLAAIGFSAFWAGLWAGLNYAASFVAIHLLHWTVATKQPAMTAPAMAAKLEDVTHDASVQAFVDEVAHLIRSQVAGILGNIVMVAPVVVAVQLGWRAAFGVPLVDEEASAHVVESLTLLGPTPAYAAFTGVLLFASSLVAGWVENWFVWHRLDSAIEWNPRIVARLGAPRARRWSRWWRANISGLTANVALGLMLGLVPVVATFFGLPLDVRHVTLAAGQLAAATGAYGRDVLHLSAFWWCVASIPVIAALNLSVSFFLAFRLALRSRGLQSKDRSRVYAAIRARLWRAPISFLWPPRVAAATVPAAAP